MRFSTAALTLLTIAVAAISTSAAPVPEVDSQTSSIEARSISGEGTYYYPDEGACGWENPSTELVAAISEKRWSSGSHCGDKAKVCHNSKCVTVKIVDECPGCSSGSLDLSPAAFKKLAKLSVGVIDITWSYE